MARRADHTRDELMELAAAAGHARLSEGGLAAFSARQVAADIGYTVGTLYNVFGSYDGLMLHIHARTLDDWYLHLEKAAQRRAPLQALAAAYLDYARRHRHAWLALFEYHGDETRALPDWYEERLERLFALAESALPLQGRTARQAARALWAGVHGICVLSLSGKLGLAGGEKPETLMRFFISRFEKGIAHG